MHIRQLADDETVVLVSDLHIGGSGGDEIFASAPELTEFLVELQRTPGPVQLVIVGDFFDVERMGDPSAAREGISHTLSRADYRDLWEAFRQFRQVDGHRVVYLIGNHDVAIWRDRTLQQLLLSNDIVDEIALSYAAQYRSLPGRLVYAEHGNQFDASNRFADYDNPLDKPIGDYVVSDIVRPIGGRAEVGSTVDLAQINFVFPLRAVPEWLTGRVFYRFLTDIAYLLIIPVLVINAASAAISYFFAGNDELTALRTLFGQVSYGALLLILMMVVVFVIARRVAVRAVSVMTPRFGGRKTEPELIRELLLSHDSPPQGPGIDARDIAVFVSAHTHSPAMTALDRPDGRRVAVVNTGCWLRQLHSVRAHLHAPRVYVPVYVQSHLVVRRAADGLTVELWNRPKPAERQLPWMERLAIAGRVPARTTTTAPTQLSQEAV